MSIDYKKAKSLCTATEYDLLEEAKPGAIALLTDEELKRKRAHARRLADKWREQAIEQGNSTDGSAQRSQEKHGMFQEALKRFETKLAESYAAQAATKAAAQAALAKPSVKKAEAKPAQASRQKAAKKKASKQKVAARKTTNRSTAEKEAPAKKAAAKQPPENAAALSRESKGIQKGRTTDQRVEKSGLNTRVKGHVSASGRRNQAARSSRKRS